MTPALVWKIVRIAAPWIIGAIIGGIIVGKAQQIRIDTAAVSLDLARQELTVCHDANETNQDTISKLKTELKGALKNCETRIRIKEQTLEEIRMIDGIAVRRDDNEGSDDSDPLLVLLNGMFHAGQADRQN